MLCPWQCPCSPAPAPSATAPPRLTDSPMAAPRLRKMLVMPSAAVRSCAGTMPACRTWQAKGGQKPRK
eukprot:1143871-Pelagomonas_calceolata.AAC.6